MSLIAQTDLEERIGQAEVARLTDDDADGAVDAAALSRIIDDGESEILSRLGQRYRLPLRLRHATDERVVKGYCLDVIVYRAYMRRDRSVTEDIASAYRQAIAWADKIAEGKLGLIEEIEAEEAPLAGGGIIVHGSERVISRESMRGL